MTVEPREPSRLPVRGTIAAAGTVGALALLLSVRGGPLAPSEPILAAGQDTGSTDELIAGTVTETSSAEASPGPITLSGDPVPTEWGDVQVAVVLDGGDILDVTILALPDGDRFSAQISDHVAPLLREEAIAYDTSDVSVISGATYTSEAYALSLQSALDQLGGGAAATEVTGAEPEADRPEADRPEVNEPAAPAEAPLPVPESGPVTVTGDPIAIRWGDVQVAVTVDGTDIVDVETLAIPLGDRKSQQISQRAEPVLREEAIDIDSAEVSVISGATYTSRAYAASLQSALDQLGL